MWLDPPKIKGVAIGGSIHATLTPPAPIRIEAAMQSPFMREREVASVVRKIYASFEHAEFPMDVSVLDALIRDYVLTMGERIALKSGLSRAGLLR